VSIADTPPPVAQPAVSHAARVSSGVPGMSERELREIDTITLGPAHAAEHAEMRAAWRAQRKEGGQAADDPQVRARLVAAAAAEAAADDPAEVGRWDFSATVTFPIIAIHAVMLPTGKVMEFSFPKDPYVNSAQAWLWDPATGALTRRDPPLYRDPIDGQMKPANIWCSGHTFTADGELVVFGGNLDFPTADKDYKGLNKVYTFNPWTETWREQPDMRHGRWYPTGIRTADGRIPILSGWDETGTDAFNTDIELFTPPSTIGGLGTTTLIGNTGGTGEPPTGEYYPHMFQMPSGHVLVEGPNTENTWSFDSIGTDSFTWSDYPDLTRRRVWGTAVPLPGGTNGSPKIMALGGTDWSDNPAGPSTEVFDESNSAAGWQSAPPLVIGRAHANTVLLPDGSMVEVGGGIGNVATAPSPHHAANPEQRHIELWNPQTGQWRLGPEQAEYRAYHSTALLLPDARVLSAGDDFNGGIEDDTGELYEPPYLFRGPRPTIVSAPAAVNLGADFGVTTPDTNIKRAALVAPGAATHAVDMNQRFVPLKVSQRDGCVDLTAPPNANVAPPGYYMLFLLNDQGVPSVAKFVKVVNGGASPGTCDAPPPPPDTEPPSVTLTDPTSGTSVSTTVDLSATASDSMGVAGVRFEVDGSPIGGEDTSSPYKVSWDTTTVSNGTHAITAVARDAAGHAATSTPVTVTVANTGPPDTTAPSVSLTSPAAGATVSGSIAVTAGATDDVGVEEVQFKLDGQNLGPADTSAPYSVSWSSTGVENGSHTLTAVARDAASNAGTSAAVGVNVQNAAPPTDDPSTEPPPGTSQSPSSPSATPPSATPPSVDPAPTITRLKLSPATFRTRSKVSLRLSEAARVTLSFERKLKSGRYAGLRTGIAFQGKTGSNAAWLSRRLSRRATLSPGRYRLTAVAKDGGGKRSAPVRAGFRLLTAPKPHRRVAAAMGGVRLRAQNLMHW
jgi:hypothetical protein